MDHVKKLPYHTHSIYFHGRSILPSVAYWIASEAVAALGCGYGFGVLQKSITGDIGTENPTQLNFTGNSIGEKGVSLNIVVISLFTGKIHTVSLLSCFI